MKNLSVQILTILLLAFLFGALDANSKTLKVDQLEPSVTDGSLTLIPNGTGSVILDNLTGVAKLSSGTLSTSNIDLASEVAGVLSIANGGTGASSQNFVDLTSIQSIGGAKTFSDAIEFAVNITMSGTGAIKVPVGTDAQRPAPAQGMVRYNTDQSSFEGYDGTEWSGLSGGAADFKELMTDSSFEKDDDEGTCVNCTASLVSAITVTPSNVNRLSLVFSAAGNYTVDKTTGDGFFGLPSSVQCEVSTTNSDIDFAHRSNGTNVATVDVDAVTIASGAGATTKVTRALKSNVIGTTSEGFQIIAGSAGTVFLDNCTVSTKQVLSSIGADSNWKSYTPTYTGFGTVSDNVSYYRRNGKNLEVAAAVTMGTVDGTLASITLPSGLLIDASSVTINSTTGQPSANVGTYVNNGGGAIGAVLASTNTSTTILYFGNKAGNVSNMNFPVSGSTMGASAGSLTLNFSVPIQGWTASFDALSDSAGGSNIRLDTANGYGSTANRIRRFTNQRVNIGSNIDYVDSVADGASFTVKRSGFYFISYSDQSSAAGGFMGISLNASDLTQNIESIGVTERLAITHLNGTASSDYGGVSWAGWLWSGDIIRPHTNANLNGTNANFSIVGLLDQINAILKDVVMSPGSSNGKPVILNNKVDASEVITSPLGDSAFISSCTDAAPSVCTLVTTVIQGSPECWSQGASSYVSAHGATTVTIERSAASTPFSLFCKGLVP